jgi:hypothetical protein
MSRWKRYPTGSRGSSISPIPGCRASKRNEKGRISDRSTVASWPLRSLDASQAHLARPVSTVPAVRPPAWRQERKGQEQDDYVPVHFNQPPFSAGITSSAKRSICSPGSGPRG